MNFPQFTAFYSCESAETAEKTVEDIDWLFKTYKGYMYARLQEMFTYKNLPESIPAEMLEYYLLSSGVCFVTKVDDKLYAFQGGLGGELDAYYRPTLFTVANPALSLSKSYEIGKDGILVRNDKMWMGLDKLFTRYAYLMSTNLVTIQVVDVILRCIALLSAPDDKSKASAEEYLIQLKAGKLGVIADNPFFDGIKMQSPPANNGSYLTQFIELHQYYKGSFYNEVGLNANFNMKREAIGKGEASLSEDSLLPLCDTMLECRKEDIRKINEMFGTNIEVEFNSVWKQNQKENVLEIKQLEKEASQLEGDEENVDTGREETKVDKGSIGDDYQYAGNPREGRGENEGKTEEETERVTECDGTNQQRKDVQTSDESLSDEQQENSNENSEEDSEENNITINNNIVIEGDDNVAEKEKDSENKGDNDSD